MEEVTTMRDQDQAATPSRSLQRLAEEVRASRLLMRQRLSQVSGAEPGDQGTGPSGQLRPLSRLFADLCD